jgi:DNA-binding CsgD family transcriptional regulator
MGAGLFDVIFGNAHKQDHGLSIYVPIRGSGGAKMDEQELTSILDNDFLSQEAKISDKEFIFLNSDIDKIGPHDLTPSGNYNLSDITKEPFVRFLQMMPMNAFLVDEDRLIAFTNKSLEYQIDTRDGLVGKVFSSTFVHPPHAQKAEALLEKAFFQRRSWIIEAPIQIGAKKGYQRLHLRPIRLMNERFVLVLMLDLTAAKIQDALNKKYRLLSQLLEVKVRERTKHIEESKKEIQQYSTKLAQTNDALRVLISGIERQKKSVEKRIAENIQRTVKPILDQLKVEDQPARIRSLVGSLERELGDIVSARGLDIARYGHLLTLREARICEMVKSGLTSKEIAKAMGVSTQTIFFHRSSIRKKLGLTGISDDLATCLKAMN